MPLSDMLKNAKKEGDLCWESPQLTPATVRNKPQKMSKKDQDDDIAWLRDPSWIKQLSENEGTRKYTEGRLFERFDKSRNEQLDVREVRQFCAELSRTLGLHEMNEDATQRLIDTCDVSQSAGLTKEEFHKFFGILLRNVKKNTPQVLESRRAQLHELVDPYVARSEAEAQEIALRVVSPPEDAVHVVTTCDVDGKAAGGFGLPEAELQYGSRVSLAVDVNWEMMLTQREYRYAAGPGPLDYTGKTQDRHMSQSIRVLFDQMPGAEAGTWVLCSLMVEAKELGQLETDGVS